MWYRRKRKKARKKDFTLLVNERKDREKKRVSICDPQYSKKESKKEVKKKESKENEKGGKKERKT